MLIIMRFLLSPSSTNRVIYERLHENGRKAQPPPPPPRKEKEKRFGFLVCLNHDFNFVFVFVLANISCTRSKTK
jgi:hypothetical protein